MDELIAVRDALSVEMQDCYNQGDRQTAVTMQRVINAIDRALVSLDEAADAEATEHQADLEDSQ